MFRSHNLRSELRNGSYGSFHGIFDSFTEAEEALPEDKPLGYNHAELAKEYQNKLGREVIEDHAPIPSFEYPVLFWLSKIKQLIRVPIDVFDFGGNVGTHWYRYRPFLDGSEINRWCVIDLPEIVRAGKDLAKESSAPKLSFSPEFPVMERPTIFLASSALQYVDVSKFLRPVEEVRPPYVIVNRVPLSDRDFATLQNGGRVYYASRIFEERGLEQSFEELGYRCLDSWRDDFDGERTVATQTETREILHKGFLFRAV